MLTWASDFTKKRFLIEMCSVVISLPMKELGRQLWAIHDSLLKKEIKQLINIDFSWMDLNIPSVSRRNNFISF